MWDSVPVEIGLVADSENGFQFQAFFYSCQFLCLVLYSALIKVNFRLVFPRSPTSTIEKQKSRRFSLPGWSPLLDMGIQTKALDNHNSPFLAPKNPSVPLA